MISFENHIKIVFGLAGISLMTFLFARFGFTASADSWTLLAKDMLYMFLAFIACPLLWISCLYGITRGFVPAIKGESSQSSGFLSFTSLLIFMGLNVTLPYIYA